MYTGFSNGAKPTLGTGGAQGPKLKLRYKMS